MIQQNNAAGLKQHGIHCSGAISSPPFNCCLHQQHHHHPLIHMPSSMIAFLLLLIASSSFLLVTSSLESDEIDVGPLNPQPDDNDTQPPESNIVVEDAIIDSPTTTTTTTTTNTTTITTTTPPTTTAIVAAEAAVGNIPHVSLSNSGDEDIESLKRVIDQTNDRLIHLLAEQERIASSLEEARADMVSMRAQVQEKLSQMDRFMQNEARQNISSTTLPGQTDPMCMVTEWYVLWGITMHLNADHPLAQHSNQ